MEHIRKRTLSILLTLVLLFSLVPGMSGTAYADTTYTVTWDINTLKSMGRYEREPYEGESFTKDGVTLTVLSGYIDYGHYDDYVDVGWYGYSDNASFKFSTTSGNF